MRRRTFRTIVRLALAVLLLFFWDCALGLYVHRHSPSLARPHPVLIWRLRSNLRSFWDGRTYVSTNSRGLRSREVPLRKGSGEYRVLLAGDSSTFGDGVTAEETYGARLEALLNDRRPDIRWTVINGAMKGYSSFQGLYLLRKVCLRYNPDCLVIAYLHSDFVRDALEDKRANTNPPVVRALQELLYESNLYLLLRQKLLEMKPAAAPGASRVHRVSKDDFGRNLREIAGLCRARGIRMIFLNMPEEKRNTPGEDDPWRAAMKEAAGESGSPVLDLLDLFNKGERKGERLCFDSVHPNKEGHAVIAEALFKELAGKEAR